jgi:DNA-binding MarR family transcriptional regulator
MRLLVGATQRFLGDRARAAGLNQRDFLALIRLTSCEAMTGAQLGGAIGLTSSSITGLADRLEKAKLITRAAHPTDRRLVVLRPTARGRSVVARALDPTLERLAQMMGGLDQQQFAAVAAFLHEAGRVLDEERRGRASAKR